MDIEVGETLIWQGDSIKATGSGRVSGYLVRYSTEDDPDLEGEFFTKDTDFGDLEDGDKTSFYWHHGLDPEVGIKRLGKGTLKKDDVGIWVEGVLSLREEYEQAIYKLAEQGKLGWSSGSAAHLTQKQKAEKATWITAWPIVESSLTPTPAEPRTSVVPLKSLIPDIRPTGHTLNDHTSAVLAAVECFTTRLEGYVSLKTSEGRVVPAERREQFRELKARLEQLILICEPKPRKNVELQKHLLKLRADVLKLEMARGAKS